jgi:hypothetical protein
VRSTLLLSLIAGLLPGTGVDARPPVSAHAMLYLCCTPPAMKERIFAESKAMGASYVRVDVDLRGIFELGGAPRPRPDWRALDEVISLSRRYRLPVLGILLRAPSYISTCPERVPSPFLCPPRDPEEFGRLAGEVAAHARGAIAHWQILNEPDGSWAFEGTPEDYARMLSASHRHIKANAPEAEVVLGGLMSPHDPSWLERVFATPGTRAARSFDIAALHLRTPARRLAVRLRAWRGLLARHGFAGRIWVTEHGYSADPAYQNDRSFPRGELGQAAYLESSVKALVAAGAEQVFVTLRGNEQPAYASEGVAHIGGPPRFESRRRPAFAVVRRIAGGSSRSR